VTTSRSRQPATGPRTANLTLAVSLIDATARAHGAELWTQDRHFEGLAGVRYFAKG
jgi:predicted nucleic acid-binding protein